MSFSSLGLSEQLVRATADQGYETPSPIQAKAIPAVLSGRDVMAAAQTVPVKPQGSPCHCCSAWRKTPALAKARVY